MRFIYGYATGIAGYSIETWVAHDSITGKESPGNMVNRYEQSSRQVRMAINGGFYGTEAGDTPISMQVIKLKNSILGDTWQRFVADGIAIIKKNVTNEKNIVVILSVDWLAGDERLFEAAARKGALALD